jgi:hypothetical protein
LADDVPFMSEPELDRKSFPRLQSWLQFAVFSSSEKTRHSRKLLVLRCPGREIVSGTTLQATWHDPYVSAEWYPEWQ